MILSAAALGVNALGVTKFRNVPEKCESVSEENSIEVEIKALLASQKFAVLSTQEENRPYTSLVAFAATDDLKSIFFATTRSTRKYANMAARSGTALLVDNRSNRSEDIRSATALTVLGDATEVPASERPQWAALYIAKHPHMREFLSSPSTALMTMIVESYLLVRRFQNVTILKINP